MTFRVIVNRSAPSTLMPTDPLPVMVLPEATPPRVAGSGGKANRPDSSEKSMPCAAFALMTLSVTVTSSAPSMKTPLVLVTVAGRESHRKPRVERVELISLAAVLARFFFSWPSNVVALFVAALVIPGIDYGDTFWALFLAGLVFALVNLVVRPLVILLALPAVILTLGLALFLVNTFMLYLTDWIVPDFETGSFWSTLGGALIVWIVNVVINAVLKPGD
jgi:putative membrane protein